jgi:ABC-type Fe3+-hydroxamate transport system substrate-binding protein
VVAENPDVIVAVPHAEEDDIPSLAEYLRTNPAWAGTNAVENDRIYISVDNSLLQAGTDVARTIR